MNVKAGFAREISLLFVLGIASLAAAADCGGLSPSGTTTGSGGSQAPATGGSSGRGASGTTGSTGGTPGTGGGSSATGGVSATGGSTGRAGTSGATGGAAGGTMGTGGAAGGTMGTGGLGAAGSGGIGAGGAPGMCSKSMATFNDITSNHAVPAWLKNANYAIGMHFGPYSVGAHHTEWDSRNMYCNSAIRQWYIDHFGSNGTVGYKDLIAKMTLPNFDPASWAAVFKKAKASIVFGSAEHHDHFAMWNSPHTKWCIAKTAGRDVIGELAASVRAQGMKFGVLDHILYGYSFYWCGANADKTVDLYDPRYYDLYGDFGGWDPTRASPYASSGPPNGGCPVTGGSCQAGQPNQGFMNEWLTRAKELTDQYQPDIHWFDWDGVGATHPTKLAFASYYYNSACGWGKEVAIAGRVGDFPGDNTTTGGNVMLPDFESSGSAPAPGSEPKTVWFVNEKIGSTWSYTDGMTYQSASSLIKKIKDYKSRGGMMLLNVSPKGDGTLPQEQIDILTAIGNAL